MPAEELAGELEHVRKWPAEHWQLAFQGQLRTVSDADAGLLERRIADARAAAARAAAARRDAARAPLHARGGGGAAARVEELLGRLRAARDAAQRPARRARRSPRPLERRRRARAGRSPRASSSCARPCCELREREMVLRDLDRGLVDFPALRDGARGVPLLGGGRGPRSPSGTNPTPASPAAGRSPMADGHAASGWRLNFEQRVAAVGRRSCWRSARSARSRSWRPAEILIAVGRARAAAGPRRRASSSTCRSATGP